MLTSFFGKSSPINFLLLSIYIILIALCQGITAPDFSLELSIGMGLVIKIVLLLFLMLLLDFIIRKNNLTQAHTFGIFVFSAALLLVAPYATWSILVSQVLVLLGLRRIFSLTSNKNTEKKILDASLWIIAASFFSFWNILWLGTLYLAIWLISHKQLRYFFIPIISLLGMFLLTTAFFFVKDDSFEWFFQWPKAVSLNFSVYGSLHLWISVTLLVSVYLWSLFYRVSLLPEIPKKLKSNYLLVFYTSLIGMLIVFISENKTGGEMIFALPPMAIIIANYLERNGDLYLKEAICWVLILMPVVAIFL